MLKKLGGGRVEIVGISADEEQIAMPQPGFLITDALRDKVRTEGVALFSRADNSAIETATRRMDKFVAEFEAGRLKDGDTQILGDTPVVLLALGADNRSLQIDGATVRKALAGKHRFDLTADSLRQVARALYDPLAVFVPARIDWTLFCNSGCLSHGIGLTG
ncbi:MAG: hypothetical protein JNL58_33335, partial [Planctomyces sp.]|nr:hypothetical protein [Planctomyces sp.]